MEKALRQGKSLNRIAEYDSDEIVHERSLFLEQAFFIPLVDAEKQLFLRPSKDISNLSALINLFSEAEKPYLCCACRTFFITSAV